MLGNQYDCEPTLNDEQVVDFCRKGLLILERAIPDEINRRTMEFLDIHPDNRVDEILFEDWFMDGVIKNPQAAGAVRSLLGRNFRLPFGMSNHRVKTPEVEQGWHTDGGSIYTPRVDYLQVFYYPQDSPKELGPPGGRASFPLYPHQGQLHGPLRSDQARPCHCLAGRIDTCYHLFNLAPPQSLHCAGPAQYAQI